MPLFLITFTLFSGVVLTIFLGNKGVLFNMLMLLIISLGKKPGAISALDLLIIVLSSCAAVASSLLLVKLSRRLFDPLPFKEALLGGSTLSLLAGMLTKPVVAGGVFGTIFGFPLLRRLTHLGTRAVLLTVGGWVIRLFIVSMLNFWFFVQLL